jgi:hypothetical protein
MWRRRLLLRWNSYQKVVGHLCQEIKDGLEQAEASVVLATAGRAPKPEILLKTLIRERWNQAEQLRPDLEQLYKSIEEIMPTPKATASTRVDVLEAAAEERNHACPAGP